MKAYGFKTKGGKLEQLDKPIPEPKDHEVRVKVEACGICHSDQISKFDGMGGGLPRVPGHEIAGVVDVVGAGVTKVKKGDKVGVGWFSKGCGKCNRCTRDVPVCCVKAQATGVHSDGGYAEYAVVPEEACAIIPEQMSFSDAGPLMCAGVTTFNSLRNSGAKPGEVVAVVGVGGLGHLAIQFANKMGFHTVCLSRGDDKKELALKLGAHVYIDSKAQKASEELQKLGGAKAIIYTATVASGVTELVGGLALDGKIVLLAALTDPVNLPTLPLLGSRGSILVWASGDARDSKDTLEFAALTGIRPMVEKFPFSKVNEAYDRMLSTQAKFRVVLEGWQ